VVSTAREVVHEVKRGNSAARRLISVVTQRLYPVPELTPIAVPAMMEEDAA
jgi:hypothetical protein